MLRGVKIIKYMQKKFFRMLVAIMVIVSAMLTSCKNDDDEIIVNNTFIKQTAEIRDTVEKVVVDTVSTMEIYWFDIATLVDHYLDIGKGCSETSEYEDYVDRSSALPIHEYLVWIGYSTVNYGWHRSWQQYSIQEETEKVLPRNYQRLATFEEDVVFPARAYVQKLKDMGYGGSHYTSWIDPGDFLREAIKNYHGNDSYGYIIIVEEVARASFIFGI